MLPFYPASGENLWNNIMSSDPARAWRRDLKTSDLLQLSDSKQRPLDSSDPREITKIMASKAKSERPRHVCYRKPGLAEELALQKRGASSSPGAENFPTLLASPTGATGSAGAIGSMKKTVGFGEDTGGNPVSPNATMKSAMKQQQIASKTSRPKSADAVPAGRRRVLNEGYSLRRTDKRDLCLYETDPRDLEWANDATHRWSRTRLLGNWMYTQDMKTFNFVKARHEKEGLPDTLVPAGFNPLQKYEDNPGRDIFNRPYHPNDQRAIPEGFEAVQPPLKRKAFDKPREFIAQAEKSRQDNIERLEKLKQLRLKKTRWYGEDQWHSSTLYTKEDDSEFMHYILPNQDNRKGRVSMRQQEGNLQHRHPDPKFEEEITGFMHDWRDISSRPEMIPPKTVDLVIPIAGLREGFGPKSEVFHDE